MRVDGEYSERKQQSQDEAITVEEGGVSVGDGGVAAVDNWKTEREAL